MGSVSALEIFQRGVMYHKRALKKKSNIADVGDMSVKYSEYWALLLDIG